MLGGLSIFPLKVWRGFQIPHASDSIQDHLRGKTYPKTGSLGRGEIHHRKGGQNKELELAEDGVCMRELVIHTLSRGFAKYL